MDVVCPKCSTHHRAEPPSSLRARGAVRFRCTHCGHTFKVEFPAPTPSPTATLAPLPREEQPSPPAPATPTGYTVRAEGEVYPTTDLATLQRWILECRVKPDDQLSIDGERWERAGDRPDLELFFAAAERLHLPVRHPSLTPLPPAPAPVDLLAADPSNADAQPSRDDADIVTTLGGGPAEFEHDSVVDAVEDAWADRTQPLPEPPAEDLPRIEPDEVTRVSGMYAEPDTQESTMLSVLQERTEEIRKGPVPVRRGYTTLSGQSLPPPGQHPPPAPTLQSFQDMVAEFEAPGPRLVERSPEADDFDDEPPPPTDNRVMGILALVGGVTLIGIIAALGWHFSHTPSTVASEAHTPSTVAQRAPPVDVAPAAVTPTAVTPTAATPAAVTPTVATPAAVTPAAAPPVAAVVNNAQPAAVAARPPAAKPVAEATRPTATPVAAPPPTSTGTLSTSDAIKKGWAFANKGKYSDAFDVFSKALQKNRGNGDLLYGRGYANEKLGDDVSAAADYCDAKKSAVSEDIRRELDGALGRLHRTCP